MLYLRSRFLLALLALQARRACNSTSALVGFTSDPAIIITMATTGAGAIGTKPMATRATVALL